MDPYFPIQIPTLYPDPVNSQAGLSAYQLAVRGAPGSPPFVGSLAEWLDSLRSEPNPDSRIPTSITELSIESERLVVTTTEGTFTVNLEKQP